QSEVEFIDSIPNGQAIYYYENGNKELECNFIDGYKKGHFIGYYKSGVKKEEGTILNEEPDGLFLAYYDSLDAIMGKVTFVEGKPNGVATLYYPNGNIKSEVITK